MKESIWESPEKDEEYAEKLTQEARVLRPELDGLLQIKEEELAPIRGRVLELDNALSKKESMEEGLEGFPLEDEEKAKLQKELDEKVKLYKEVERRHDYASRMREVVLRLYWIKADRGGNLQDIPELKDLPKYPEPEPFD